MAVISAPPVSDGSFPIYPAVSEQARAREIINLLNELCMPTTSYEHRHKCTSEVITHCYELDLEKWSPVSAIQSLAFSLLDTPEADFSVLTGPMNAMKDLMHVHYPVTKGAMQAGVTSPTPPNGEGNPYAHKQVAFSNVGVTGAARLNVEGNQATTAMTGEETEIVAQISSNIEIASTLPAEERLVWINPLIDQLGKLPQSFQVIQIQTQVLIMLNAGCDDASMNRLLSLWKMGFKRDHQFIPFFLPPADSETIILASMRLMILASKINCCTDPGKRADLIEQARTISQEVHAIDLPNYHLVQLPNAGVIPLGKMKSNIRTTVERIMANKETLTIDHESQLYVEMVSSFYEIRTKPIEERRELVEAMWKLITQEDLQSFKWLQPIEDQLRTICSSLDRPIDNTAWDPIDVQLATVGYIWESILKVISNQVPSTVGDGFWSPQKEVRIVELYQEIRSIKGQLPSTWDPKANFQLMQRAEEILKEIQGSDLPESSLILVPTTDGLSKPKTLSQIKKEMRSGLMAMNLLGIEPTHSPQPVQAETAESIGNAYLEMSELMRQASATQDPEARNQLKQLAHKLVTRVQACKLLPNNLIPVSPGVFVEFQAIQEEMLSSLNRNFVNSPPLLAPEFP
jgi:hypothetical protein